MKTIETDNQFIQIFDNVNEFANILNNTPNQSGRNDSSIHGTKSFTGTKNYEESFEKLKYGDNDLYNKVKSKLESIESKNITYSTKKVFNKNVVGVIPNISAYLSNDPNYMLNVEKALKNKIVNIVLNCVYDCRKSTEEITNIGTIYLSIIKELEQRGYRVNLYSSIFEEREVDNSGVKYQYMLVRTKRDSEPLNIKKITYTIVNPSFLRRTNFKWQESLAKWDFTYRGYGRPSSSNKAKEIISKILGKDNLIYLDYQRSGYTITKDQIIEELKNNYGIDIKGVM